MTAQCLAINGDEEQSGEIVYPRLIWPRSGMSEAGREGTDANQRDLCHGKCDLAVWGSDGDR